MVEFKRSLILTHMQPTCVSLGCNTCKIDFYAGNQNLPIKIVTVMSVPFMTALYKKYHTFILSDI